MLSVVIIDDEPPARRALAALIAGHPDLRLVGQAGSLAEAVTLIQTKRPDVAFLDIELGGGNGFALMRQLPDAPHIVVVTAHSHHAPAAFDVAAVDFLLKPVSASRFATAVRRLRALHAPGEPATPQHAPSCKSRPAVGYVCLTKPASSRSTPSGISRASRWPANPACWSAARSAACSRTWRSRRSCASGVRW